MELSLEETFEDIAKHTLYKQKEARLSEIARPLTAVLEKIAALPANQEGDAFFSFTENVYPVSIDMEDSMTVIAGLYDRKSQYPVMVSGREEDRLIGGAHKAISFSVKMDGSASVRFMDVEASGPHSSDAKTYPSEDAGGVMGLIPHLTKWVEKYMPEAVEDLRLKYPDGPGGGIGVII